MLLISNFQELNFRYAYTVRVLFGSDCSLSRQGREETDFSEVFLLLQFSYVRDCFLMQYVDTAVVYIK